MSSALALSRLPSDAAARFAADREAIESHLATLLNPGVSPTPFRRAMQYAVLGQGQRFRPVLAVRIARLCGHDNSLTLRAAASVELIHCASLIVDDLPCMDDEAVRRNRPATHVAFGEPTALLSAFGLVSLAARSVVEQPCPPTLISGLIRFQCELLRCLDASGLCEGQDLDLKLTAAEREASRGRINELKTVPLFILAAQAGLMFTDPESHAARTLRRFAREFGLAFQAVDDYLDGEIPNLAPVVEQLDRARACLQPFEPAAGELHELIEDLHARCR